MKKENFLRPWVNPDGSMKPDKEIEKLGEKWSLEAWSYYLEETCDGHKSHKEIFIENPKRIENRGEEINLREFLADNNIERFPDLKEFIQQCFHELSKNEQKVLREIYWKNKTESQVAKKFGIKKGSVNSFKRRGLNKIRRLIVNRKQKNN